VVTFIATKFEFETLFPSKLGAPDGVRQQISPKNPGEKHSGC
jgi:hypothetical protein